MSRVHIAKLAAVVLVVAPLTACLPPPPNYPAYGGPDVSGLMEGAHMLDDFTKVLGPPDSFTDFGIGQPQCTWIYRIWRFNSIRLVTLTVVFDNSGRFLRIQNMTEVPL